MNDLDTGSSATLNRIEMIRDTDRSVELLMPLADFQQLNDMVVSALGKSIIDVAQHDPLRAYQLVRRGLQTIITNIVRVSVNDVPQANDDTTSEPDTSALGLEQFQQRFSNVLDGAFDFRVSIYPSQSDEEIFGMTDPTRLIDCQVEPPNLAF